MHGSCWTMRIAIVALLVTVFALFSCVEPDSFTHGEEQMAAATSVGTLERWHQGDKNTLGIEILCDSRLQLQSTSLASVLLQTVSLVPSLRSSACGTTYDVPTGQLCSVASFRF